MVRAISLFSGGLDSILATKLVLEQKIEVEAVNFMTTFCDYTVNARLTAEKLGVGFKVFDINREFLEVLKNPKHGYGSNLNPCIDCHMLMLEKAGRYMKEAGFQFLVTGEVLGERPMSQNREALRIIEKDSGLQGLILRPLSAKLLEPTVAEKEGWVRREQLLSISGRSRKPQIQLASRLGISAYPSPAGGCLLTDPGFSARMRDLMKHKVEFTINDAELLKTGRHFRLNKNTKLVVGRNEKENSKLLNLAEEGNLCFYPAKVKGPVGIGRGIFSKDHIVIASGIMARYCDKDSKDEVEIAYRQLPGEDVDSVIAQSAKEYKLDLLRI